MQETKQANMTGMSSVTTCLMSTAFTQEWIVDSGASHHVTANKDLLVRNSGVTKPTKDRIQVQVHLPTGAKWISHI